MAIEFPEFEEDLKKAVDCMKKGGVILYPTDTVWGIGCDATNPDAVKRIYEIKKRADEKSMLVLVDSMKMVEKYVMEIPEIVENLMSAAVNPLTIIYEKAHGVAANILPVDGSLGIRITRETFSKELCRRMKKPVVSTSANISGEKSPSCFNEISNEIIDAVDYVVDYRRTEKTESRPSNIIKLGPGGVFKIIR